MSPHTCAGVYLRLRDARRDGILGRGKEEILLTV
jgi:hypothetical protein